jgi:hypothetical protein
MDSDHVSGSNGSIGPKWRRERKIHIKINGRPACGIRTRKVRFADAGSPADCGNCRRVVSR